MPSKSENAKQNDAAARKRQAAQLARQDLVTAQEEVAPLTLNAQRAIVNPDLARPTDIPGLQRAAGNQAVTGLIQAKLTLGPAGDKYEQEADRVADQVMNMQSPSSGTQSGRGEVQRQEVEEEEVQTKPLAAAPTPLVQRQEMDEEELQMKTLVQRQEEEELQMKWQVQRQEEEEELQMKSLVQRQEEEEELQMRPLAQRQEEEELQMKLLAQRQDLEEEELQTKTDTRRVGLEGGRVPPNVEANIDRARGGGQPLDGSVQKQMGGSLGHDFSTVRVHADADADALNEQLSARAFTTGQDIFFRRGEYDPGSEGGQELIAHELSHVVQQSTGRVSGGGSGMTVRPAGDAFEQEADALGRQAVTQRVAETKEDDTPEIRQTIDSAPLMLQPSRAAYGEGLVQRETFMEQRHVRSHYADEETVQRPDLIGAITARVQTLRKAYQDYQAALKSGIPSVIVQKQKNWQNWYAFLKKQDVEVTPEGDFDPKSLKDRLVEYDKTPEAQAKTEITISGGTFRRYNGQPVDTKDSVTFQRGLGWEIFVMGPGGDIHMASHKIGKYHHSSLLGGGNVAAAGMMRVSSGTLQELNNHSGHYAPQEEHIRQVVRLLQKKGVALDFTLEITGGVYKGKAEDYMKSGGEKAFEFGTTQHVLTHFMKVKGLSAVKGAFTGAGWTWLAQAGGKFVLKKPDGKTPTHEEVRDFLTAHFGEEAAPHVTQLD